MEVGPDERGVKGDGRNTGRWSDEKSHRLVGISEWRDRFGCGRSKGSKDYWTFEGNTSVRSAGLRTDSDPNQDEVSDPETTGYQSRIASKSPIPH